jgi:hypothetical protein
MISIFIITPPRPTRSPPEASHRTLSRSSRITSFSGSSGRYTRPLGAGPRPSPLRSPPRARARKAPTRPGSGTPGHILSQSLSPSSNSRPCVAPGPISHTDSMHGCGAVRQGQIGSYAGREPMASKLVYLFFFFFFSTGDDLYHVGFPRRSYGVDGFCTRGFGRAGMVFVPLEDSFEPR